MKNYVLIFLAVLLIPFAAYSENMKDIKCDFQEKDENLINNILSSGTVYQNNKTTGVLCFKNDNLIISLKYGTHTFIPLNKGKAHGKVKGYYKNGTLFKEIEYKKGKKYGVEKTYNEKGVLINEIPFKNNKKTGVVKSYYDSGSIKIETPYKGDKLKGKEKKYYKNGVLKLETPYYMGIKLGEQKIYNEDGSLWGKVLYKNNQAVNGKCADGRLWTSEEIYQYDKGQKVKCQ